MVKFGSYLRLQVTPEWTDYYIDYSALKSVIKKITNRQLGAEDEFVLLLEKNLDMVSNFYQARGKQLGDELARVQKRPPTIAELKALLTQVLKLEEFAELNHTGMRKIIKKHDKNSNMLLMPAWKLRMDRARFCPPEVVHSLLMQISDLFDQYRHNAKDASEEEKLDEDEPTQKADSSKTDFQRSTRKYWVRVSDFMEVVCEIIGHLPVYSFMKPPRFSSDITSVYFDNEFMDVYHTRLQKLEGSFLVRLRWYGREQDMKSVFVEKKVHHEDWVFEDSVKKRFELKKEQIVPYLEGVDMKPFIDPKNHALHDEVQKDVLELNLKPTTRTAYSRVAFQSGLDDRVRISIDYNLNMLREHAPADSFYTPFEDFSEGDIHRFPYVVLETKLHSGKAPQWITDLTNSEKLIPMQKFSKYCHGTAMLYPHIIKEAPYWFGTHPDEFPQFFETLDHLEEFKANLEKEARARAAARAERDKEQVQRLVVRVQNMHSEPQAGASIPSLDLRSLRKVGGVAGVISAQPEEAKQSEPQQAQQTRKQRPVSRDVENGVRFDSDAGAPLLGKGKNGGGHYGGVDRPHAVRADDDEYDDQEGTWCSFFAPRRRDFERTLGRDEKDKSKQKEENFFLGCFPTREQLRRPQINQRTRIEPKTFFANERTYLHWFNAAVLLFTLGVALIHVGTQAAPFGYTFVVVALLLMIYALYTYQWRVVKLTRRDPAQFADPYAPAVLTFVIVFGIIALLAFDAVQKSLKP